MDSNASCSLLFFLAAFSCLFLLSPATTSAFNITTILSDYPNYNSFNQLLTQTGVAKNINTRSAITVLVVADGAMDSINSKPIDTAERILSTHVILDYFDMTKLNQLKNQSITVTNLYQSTGIADDQQGFLNLTKSPKGIRFGSAAKGAPLNANVVGSVMNKPYNISVLEVSAVIIAPGIDPHSPAKPPAPKMAPPPKAEAPEPAEAPESAAKPPAKAHAPKKAPPPKANAPSPAPTPAADAPKPDDDVPSPNVYPPAADAPADDDYPADEPKKSVAASSSVSGAAALILGLVVALGLC